MTDTANLSPLRAAILSTAKSFVDVVKEDDGDNRDKGGNIQKFFAEGAGYHHDHKHLPWCAAFGSYCVVKGFAAVQKPLPVSSHGAPATVLNADSAVLKRLFTEAGLYRPASEIFDGDGKLKPGATMPQPGDLMLVHEGTILHTGVVESFEAPDKLTTIEGNNKTDNGKNPDGSPAPDGVYGHHISKARLKRIDGFCVVEAT